MKNCKATILKILLIITMLSILAACGGDNSTPAPTPPPPAPPVPAPQPTPPPVVLTPWQIFHNNITEGKFARPQSINSYTTFVRLAHCTVEENSSSWWIFNFNSYVQNCHNDQPAFYTTESVTTGETYYYSETPMEFNSEEDFNDDPRLYETKSFDEQVSYLTGILAQSKSYEKYNGGTGYRILTSSNEVFIIDTSFPISSNPIYMKTASKELYCQQCFY
jgi:hypothetical protein